MEVEGLDSPDTNKNRSGYNPDTLGNLMLLEGYADNHKGISPIIDQRFTSPIGSPLKAVDQKHVTDKTTNTNKDLSSPSTGNKSPFLEDTHIGEVRTRNLQGVSEK
ncbi:hypothetical protein L1887_07151 [Cichorium endivia]|nr:hypothetical protein L1887_07151 [Cichorium endivia]